MYVKNALKLHRKLFIILIYYNSFKNNPNKLRFCRYGYFFFALLINIIASNLVLMAILGLFLFQFGHIASGKELYVILSN